MKRVPLLDPFREHHETWLYYHLDRAAKARLAVERAPSYDDCLDAEIQRKDAVACAWRHYRALLARSFEMDPLLGQMALTEGLTP